MTLILGPGPAPWYRRLGRAFGTGTVGRSAAMGALGLGALGAGVGGLAAGEGHRLEGALGGGLSGVLLGGGLLGRHRAGMNTQAAQDAYEKRRDDTLRSRAQAYDRRETERQERYNQDRAAILQKHRDMYKELSDFHKENQQQQHRHVMGDKSPTNWYNMPKETRPKEPPTPDYPEVDRRFDVYDQEEKADPYHFFKPYPEGPNYKAPPLHGEIPWLKGVTTQADAHQRFRDLARANHPDLGGSKEKMQEINKQWDAAQAHPGFSKLGEFYAAGYYAAWAKFVR